MYNIQKGHDVDMTLKLTLGRLVELSVSVTRRGAE